MKTAVVAIDAAREQSHDIQNFCNALIRIQNLGLLEDLHIGSVIHPGSFLLPYSYYRAEKHNLGKQVEADLARKLDPNLRVGSVNLIISEHQEMDSHVQSIYELGRQTAAEVLVVRTQPKSTLSYLIQGSFSEAASLKAPLPVLVLGDGMDHIQNSPTPTVLVAFCISNPPSAASKKWIVNLALQLKARIHLLPVDDLGGWWYMDRKLDPKTAAMIHREFKMEGLLSVRLLTADPVRPMQIPAIADQNQACLTIWCPSSATMKRPMFAPSVSGRLISEMSRPILILKEENKCIAYDQARRPMRAKGTR